MRKAHATVEIVGMSVLAPKHTIFDGLRDAIRCGERSQGSCKVSGVARLGCITRNLTQTLSPIHFGAPDVNHPNCLACVDQRDGQRGAKTELQRRLPALGIFIRFG